MCSLKMCCEKEVLFCTFSAGLILINILIYNGFMGFGAPQIVKF